MQGESYIPTLNLGLRVFFTEFVRVSVARPSRAFHFAVILARQLHAARLRNRWEHRGLHVPPMTIFSITNLCNLQCQGCYAQAIRRENPRELSVAEIRRIVTESVELGVSFFIIAGGEPLLRPQIVELASEFRRAFFLLVTNGLLLDSAMIRRLRKQPNTIPVLSIEGNEAQTDDRRGTGVHRRITAKMEELRSAEVLFSLSITVNRHNFPTVTDPRFIRGAIRAGCRFFLFLEYTPVREGTDDWLISDDQRELMAHRILSFRSQHRAVFIAVPWDEEGVGGCLAAGRGFIHISANGALEPCPFAPYSDVSLRDTPLKEALQSRFLTLLREHHGRFEDMSGGCSLWKEREAVGRLLAE